MVARSLLRIIRQLIPFRVRPTLLHELFGHSKLFHVLDHLLAEMLITLISGLLSLVQRRIAASV